MHETDYRIEKVYNNVMVTIEDKIIAQGLGDTESALHCIWVIEGKNENEFYVEKDGIVKMIERDIL